MKRTQVSPDSVLLRFALPSPAHVLGLPVGMHMLISARIGGKLVMRAYTPVSSDADAGHFDLLIKVYRPGADPAFPNGGLMSTHLDALPLGGVIEAKGPIGEIVYGGRGLFTIGGVAARHDAVVMIAGGSGITPHYQILRAALADADDRTRFWLLYGNKTEEDILLRAELEALRAAHPLRFMLRHQLTRVPRGGTWNGPTGRVDVNSLRAMLPPGCGAEPAEALVLLCGPEGMQNAAMSALKEMGFPAEHMHLF